MVSIEDFAKYSQYQASLNEHTPVTAIAELGNTCIVSSSNQWVIGSGATDHMTDNPDIFSTFRSHTASSSVTYNIVRGGLYILDPWVPRSIACSVGLSCSFHVEEVVS